MSQWISHDVIEDSTLSLYDLLSLPEDKRRVLAWIQKQTVCSLKTLIDCLDQTEEVVCRLLQELLQQGFIKTVTADQETLYQVCFASPQRRRAQPRIDNILDAIVKGE
ncbi:MAG: hypothetical protein AAGE59_05035 [Cyanobacteria bacterium P01_F01_bin.86]